MLHKFSCLQWVTLHYKILQKQSNLRISLKVAQKVFSKEGDKLFDELQCTWEKLLYLECLNNKCN